MKKASAALVIGLLLLAVWGCGGEEPEAAVEPAPQARADRPEPSETPAPQPEVEMPAEPLAVGAKFPRYVATSLDGSQMDLSQPTDKVRLVNIWATWCTPCRYEIPALISLQDELEDSGLEIVGVSIDAPQAVPSIEGFVKARGINYTITHDPDSVITELLDSYEIPTTVLIDREGTVRWFHKGVVRQDDPELRAALEKAL